MRGEDPAVMALAIGPLLVLTESGRDSCSCSPARLDAAIDAGVHFVATDQYERLAERLKRVP